MQFSITRVFVSQAILREKYELPPPNAINHSTFSFLDIKISST